MQAQAHVYTHWSVGTSPKKGSPVRKKMALDLFSGSGATGMELHKMGYEVVSLDNNPRAHPVG